MRDQAVKAVWIYVRLSYDKRRGTAAEGTSVARQERECREWAVTNKLKVLGVIPDNDVSATSSKPRPGFEKLLGKRPPAILVWHQDRLVRRTKDLERIIDLGIPIYSVKGGALDLSTAQHIAMARTMTTWAAYEGEHRDERQKAALDEIQAKGEPGPGKARFGYLDADEKVGRRVNCKVDPKTAPTVRSMFESVAHEDPARRRTINSWAEELGWRRTRVRETLRNAAYAGTLTRAGVRYEAAAHVDRIVDRDLFERVQAVLDTNMHSGRPGGVIRHLASGIARCGICDGPMQFRNAYLCLRDLHHPTVKGEFVDRKIVFEIVNVLLSSVHDPGTAGEVPALEARLRAIDEEEAGWAQAQAGGMRWSLIAPHVETLVSERQRLQEARQRELASHTRQRVLADLRAAVVNPETRRVDMRAAGALRAEVQRRFQALPIEEQRELVAEHLDIVVHPGRGPGRVKIALRNGDEEELSHA